MRESRHSFYCSGLWRGLEEKATFMPFIALVSRKKRKITFWAQALQLLTNKHEFIVRDIDITQSTPGDLTFSQFPMSIMLIDGERLEHDELDRITTMQDRARHVVALVRNSWQSIQTQLATERHTVAALLVKTSIQAAETISALVAGYTSVSPPATIEPGSSAEMLTALLLDDDQLESLYHRFQCFADLAHVYRASEMQRRIYVQELGRHVVEAIDNLFAP